MEKRRNRRQAVTNMNVDAPTRFFAPTPETIRISRQRIAAIMRASRSRAHPFSLDDFETSGSIIPPPTTTEPNRKNRKLDKHFQKDLY